MIFPNQAIGPARRAGGDDAELAPRHPRGRLGLALGQTLRKRALTIIRPGKTLPQSPTRPVGGKPARAAFLDKMGLIERPSSLILSVEGRFRAWRRTTNAVSKRIVRANGSDLCRKTTLELIVARRGHRSEPGGRSPFSNATTSDCRL